MLMLNFGVNLNNVAASLGGSAVDRTKWKRKYGNL